MKSLIRRFKKSLTARLLLVFIATSVIIITVLIVTVIHGFTNQWRYNVRPHLVQYLDYVNADIGDPPSIERARELSERLPINLYITGETLNFSSTGKPLDFSDLEFKERDNRYKPPRRRAPPRGSKIQFGEHDDRTVLKNDLGDYQVYFEFAHRQQHTHRDDAIGKALLGILATLGLCYWLIRRMLRPVQDIQSGVIEMGNGKLDHRVPVRSDNDLGDLATSINTMAGDIEQMLDAKRQLLLGVSHELRSPLTRATIAAQMLEESPNSERIKDDLREMESLIAEILETERINTRHAPIQRTPVDINALINTVLADLKIDAKVDVKAGSNLPLLMLDETRLKLALRNMINNAISHGSNAGIAPAVTATLENDTLNISVRDYGPGIPADHIDNVTEPFYRVDPSRTRATGGFGIGLYLCRLIAEAHQGKLTVVSQLQASATAIAGEIPEHGTTVTLVLPIISESA